MVGDEESMTKPLRERWQLHRGLRNRLVILGRAGQECWSFEQFLGQDKKKSHCAFSCRPRQGRPEAAGLGWWRGAFSLGLGHRSSLCRRSPRRPWCFSCSHSASLGNAAHQRWGAQWQNKLWVICNSDQCWYICMAKGGRRGFLLTAPPQKKTFMKLCHCSSLSTSPSVEELVLGPWGGDGRKQINRALK